MPYPATPRLRPQILAALAAMTILALSGCDKNAADPPLPRAENFPVAPAIPGDTSVPSASVAMPAVDAAPAAPKDSPPATQTNAPLTDKQEATAMPLGGQANDHSAPKPAEAASAASAP